MDRRTATKNSTSWLSHRFAQFILTSSCTATTTAVAAASIPPLVQVSVNCGGAAHRSVDKHDESGQNRPPVPQSSLPGSNLCYNHALEKTIKKKKHKPPIMSDLKWDAERRGGTRQSRKAYGFSSSSSFDSENELSLFSCEEDDEGEESATFFSSKSFSSDSSAFYSTNRRKKKKKKKSSKTSKSNRRPSPSSFSSAAGAAGVAVVKKSSNPYMDFRWSMMEMIAERGGLKSRKEMEGLLHSYLLLNSACHHPVISKAFADVWEAYFCCLD